MRDGVRRAVIHFSGGDGIIIGANERRIDDQSGTHAIIPWEDYELLRAEVELLKDRIECLELAIAATVGYYNPDTHRVVPISEEDMNA